MKTLLGTSPADWPRLLGHPVESAEVIDADIATVSGAADKVIKVKGKPDWIQHLEFQVGPDALKPRKINVYTSILEDRHNCPVHSALILLARRANLRSYTGIYERRLPGRETPYRIFRYDVVRVWELSPDAILQGGLSLLPLAPLTKVEPKDLPDLLLEMKRIVEKVNDPQRALLHWSTTDILMRLRFDDDFIAKMIQGVLKMKHSAYFQSLLDELDAPALKQGKKNLLRFGEIQFGPAPEEARVFIESLGRLDEVDALIDRFSSATSWQELLQLPAKKPTRRKRAKGT